MEYFTCGKSHENEREVKMGLDMYLSVRTYVSGYEFSSTDEKSKFAGLLKTTGLNKDDLKWGNPSGYALFTVGYWRKANAIHKWFVENIQGGVDECQLAHVSREKLQELKDACDEVLGNATKAKDLLPTQGGFFFGETEYDEWYHDEVKHTADMLGELLANPKFVDSDFEYQASW